MIFEMEHYFLVCFGLLRIFSSMKGCPANCFCDELQTDCVVHNCDDGLPIQYTDFLKITGELCMKQRLFLSKLSPNTIVILETDSCVGIKNCRDDRSIKQLDEVTVGVFREDEGKELIVPAEGVPFLPIQIGDGVDNGANNNGDNNGDNDEAAEVMTEEPSVETTVETSTEMTTETSTEEETTTEMMAIIPYRNQDRDEDGNTLTTVYRR